MPLSSHPSSNFVFAGAAHIDRTGWLAASSVSGCSNPARIEEYPGGTCFNIAGNLASLGNSPVLFTQLGDDGAARVLQKTAAERGIKLHFEASNNQATGTYTSIIEPDGSLLIGLADMSVYDKFDASKCIEHCKTLNLDDWLGLDTNLPETEITRLVEHVSCRTAGFTVSKAKATKLRPVLSKLDVLFTNHVEVCALLGLDEAQSDQVILTKLKQSGLSSAVISREDGDVMVMENGIVTTIPVHASSRLVDVTGAGDALVAGTMHRLVDNVPLAKAVEFGIATARQIVEVKGAWRPDLSQTL